MQLNIKNDETYQLATELADLTRETLTRTVTIALRERLTRLKRRQGGRSLVEASIVMQARHGDEGCLKNPKRKYRPQSRLGPQGLASACAFPPGTGLLSSIIDH